MPVTANTPLPNRQRLTAALLELQAARAGSDREMPAGLVDKVVDDSRTSRARRGKGQVVISLMDRALKTHADIFHTDEMTWVVDRAYGGTDLPTADVLVKALAAKAQPPASEPLDDSGLDLAEVTRTPASPASESGSTEGVATSGSADAPADDAHADGVGRIASMG